MFHSEQKQAELDAEYIGLTRLTEETDVEECLGSALAPGRSADHKAVSNFIENVSPRIIIKASRMYSNIYVL